MAAQPELGCHQRRRSAMVTLYATASDERAITILYRVGGDELELSDFIPREQGAREIVTLNP
jgi:hypothetical protein